MDLAKHTLNNEDNSLSKKYNEYVLWCYGH